MKKLLLIILIIPVLALSGCVIELNGRSGFNESVSIEVKPGVTVKTGELKTYTEEFPLDGQNNLDVNMRLNAANVTLKKSDDKLFEGEIKTNIIGLEPKITLSGNDLDIGDQFNFAGINNHRNDWDLKLTGEIPTNIRINSNATKNDFDFTGMNITDISIYLNAADADIRFDEKNTEDMNDFELELNAGNAEVSGLDNAGADDLDVKVNAGKAELYFGENISKDMEISIEANAANVLVSLPENVGVSVEKNGSLSTLDIKRSDMEREDNDNYESSNYDSAQYKIHIKVRGTASSITIR